MIASLTVVCTGRPDNQGRPTHRRTVVADLGLHPTLGVVVMGTAQQRGNSEAGRPRFLDNALRCLICTDSVRVGKAPYQWLRGFMTRVSAAGVHELSLQALRH